jgi:hypothetical protein
MDIEKKKNEIAIIKQFPSNPKIFEHLALMFKNRFSGFYDWSGIEDYEYSSYGKYLSAKFEYYLKTYDLIQKYWRELKAIFDCIAISENVAQPGELFILILKNDSLHWQENRVIDKSVCRNVFEGWYEYQKCRMTGKNSKKLDTIINRIKKKSKPIDSENTLIFDLIYSVISKEDKTDFEDKGFLVNDINVRHLRNNRDVL